MTEYQGTFSRKQIDNFLLEYNIAKRAYQASEEDKKVLPTKLTLLLHEKYGLRLDQVRSMIDIAGPGTVVVALDWLGDISGKAFKNWYMVNAFVKEDWILPLLGGILAGANGPMRESMELYSKKTIQLNFQYFGLTAPKDFPSDKLPELILITNNLVAIVLDKQVLRTP